MATVSRLEEIRARRSRLEQLTRDLRNGSPSYTPFPQKASKYQPRLHENKSVSNVKLEPLPSRVVTKENPIDTYRKEDLLLQKSLEQLEDSNDGELLRQWRNQNKVEKNARKRSPGSPGGSHAPPPPVIIEQERISNVRLDNEDKNDDDEDENNDDEDDDDADDDNTNDEDKENENAEEADDEVDKEEIKEIIGELNGRTEQERLNGAQRARKFLSSDQPPIDAFLENGILPPLLQCLKANSPTLQFEAVWSITNIASGNSEQAKAVSDASGVAVLVDLLGSPYVRVADQSVWALGNLAGDNGKLRDEVVRKGAIPPLRSMINRSSSLTPLRNLAWTFGNIVRHRPLILSDADSEHVIKAIRLFLHHPDTEIHATACWSIVHMISADLKLIQKVIDSGVLPRLVELLESEEPFVISPCIRALGNIMIGSDTQTDQVINAGALPLLINHLKHEAVPIRRDATWALSNVMAGNSNQIQLVLDYKVLPIFIDAMENEVEVIRGEATWCVCNMTAGCSSPQMAVALEAGILNPLCDVLSPVSNRDDKLVLVVLEGIINILEGCAKPNEIRKKVNRLVEEEDKDVLRRHPIDQIRRAAEQLFR